jgi:hypothetical protein
MLAAVLAMVGTVAHGAALGAAGCGEGWVAATEQGVVASVSVLVCFFGGAFVRAVILAVLTVSAAGAGLAPHRTARGRERWLARRDERVVAAMPVGMGIPG